jgi:copper resistance protein B
MTSSTIRTVALLACLIGGAARTSAQAPAEKPQSPAQAVATHDHGGHEPPTGDQTLNAPPLTDEDRAAAFPDVSGHMVHDDVTHFFVLFDQLEYQHGGGSNGVNWDNRGWIGGDRTRFWFRAEGEGENGRVDDAHVHALYGRAIAPWWDVVAGVRQDFRPGDPQTWAAIGIQGLAPFWLDVEATGYVGAGGRTQARVEVEYQLLLTNRLVLQPLIETEIYGKSDPGRGIGAGLSSAEAGLRLRYEVRRELAPYVGLSWQRAFGKTADFAKERGDDVSSLRLVIGVRTWF